MTSIRNESEDSTTSSNDEMNTNNLVVIITGGSGFLGQSLAISLLEQQKQFGLIKLILADLSFPTLDERIEQEKNVIITKLIGDISDPRYCKSLYNAAIDTTTTDDDDDDKITTTANNNEPTITAVSVFHLASIMSGEGEKNFDLCMRVNLHGFLNMIEGARRHVFEKYNILVKFIFCSSGFTIGSGSDTDYVSNDDIISDSSKAVPHTTYGTTKACCELLLSDYTRKGYIDGRGVRLPTIIIRGGKPNAATTGCYSSIIREPLAGIDVTVPIQSNVKHAVTGKRAAIKSLLILHNIDIKVIEENLGYDRTVFLPAVPVSLHDLYDTLLQLVLPECHNKLGKIIYNIDNDLSNIVNSFPTKVDATRAIKKLNIPPAPTIEMLIQEYVQDYHNAIVNDIQFLF